MADKNEVLLEEMKTLLMNNCEFRKYATISILSSEDSEDCKNANNKIKEITNKTIETIRSKERCLAFEKRLREYIETGKPIL